MTSVRSLRVWKIIPRPFGAPVPQRSFHVGRSSCTSRLLKDDKRRGHAADADAPRESEFKKMRTRTLGEPAARELYSETHPRLKPRQGRTSISKFKQKQPDPVDIVTLYGRVQSIRRMSNKLVFVTIVNEVETVQGMINLTKISPVMTKEAFKLFSKMIEKGDHISLTGVPTHSSTGDLVVEASVLPELLSPAMEAIPDSLTDAETKSQKRHVDMLVNPEVADTLRLKSHIMQYIRDHFVEDDFLEVQTPILAHNAGGAVARPFTTRATEFPSRELSLRVAPELWLKRLVVGGLNRVFEMGPAFRNEGIDGTHNPEFTMCEFYCAYTNLEDLIDITEGLMAGLATRCNEVIDAQLKSLDRVDEAKFHAPFNRIEFVPALERELGFRLPNLSGADALPELLAVLKLGGVDLPGAPPQTLAKLLDRLAAIYLEPKSFRSPAFITHHPACMSPLSKSFLCPTTGQLVSARAELFVDGRELANMYEEENDPAEQARKLAEYRASQAETPDELDLEDEIEDGEEALQGKQANEPGQPGEEELEPAKRQGVANADADADADPADKSYIKAMEAGLPPTGGWGCGVERLVMLFSGANRISDCLTFGTLRNVVGMTSEGQSHDSGKPEGKPEHAKKGKSGGSG